MLLLFSLQEFFFYSGYSEKRHLLPPFFYRDIPVISSQPNPGGEPCNQLHIRSATLPFNLTSRERRQRLSMQKTCLRLPPAADTILRYGIMNQGNLGFVERYYCGEIDTHPVIRAI